MLPIQRQLFPLLPNKSPPHYTPSRLIPVQLLIVQTRHHPHQLGHEMVRTHRARRSHGLRVLLLQVAVPLLESDVLLLQQLQVLLELCHFVCKKKGHYTRKGKERRLFFKDLLEAAISAKRQRMGRILLGRGQSDSSVYVPRYIPYTVSLLLCHYPYTNNTWLIQQWLLLFVSLFLF